MTMSKKQIYLSIGIVAAVASLVGSVLLYEQQTTANEFPTTLIDYGVDVPPGLEDPIKIQKGQTRVIPLTLMAPKEKPLNVKIGVVAEGEEATFSSVGLDKLPAGLSAILDKRNINLPAEAAAQPGNGFPVNRGTIQLALTAGPDMKTGVHSIVVMLVQELENGEKTESGKFLRIDVQE